VTICGESPVTQSRILRLGICVFFSGTVEEFMRKILQESKRYISFGKLANGLEVVLAIVFTHTTYLPWPLDLEYFFSCF
jgi:hypothetical protein